ncbi:MAG: ABC transporter permease [Gammaproteobacteria bacterium]|nr:ABC transporter permease [Gammaproteobacteria bacterium]
MLYPADVYADARDAWSSLRRRAVRSSLSALGIAIGVVALVSMLSIGEGAKRATLQRISSLGIETVRIESAPPLNAFAGVDVTNLSVGLTVADAQRIAAWLAGRGTLGYFARNDEQLVTAANHRALATVVGASADWLPAETLRAAAGRLLLPSDNLQQRRVCVLGARLGITLAASIGTPLHTGNQICKVVGILRPRGRLLTEGTGLSALDFDNALITPFTTSPFPSGARQRGVHGMLVRLRNNSPASLPGVAENLKAILRETHRDVTNYRIVVPYALLNEARDTQALFQLVMGAIAGLSLLVGGIGVMNVMLSNVTEQTHEIGLRMAVGATRARIVSLYMCHSALLCFAGGVVGLMLGIAAALLVQTYAGWAVAFSLLGLCLGPASALLTGLVFGLHPALRAAALNPALALRES